MMRPEIDESVDDKPLSPEIEAVRRKLARLMAVSVGTMLIGLMAVLFALVYKLSSNAGPETPQAVAAAPGVAGKLEFVLPAGGEIVSHAVSGSMMTFDVRLADGRREIHVFDMAQNKTTAVIAVKP